MPRSHKNASGRITAVPPDFSKAKPRSRSLLTQGGRRILLGFAFLSEFKSATFSVLLCGLHQTPHLFLLPQKRLLLAYLLILTQFLIFVNIRIKYFDFHCIMQTFML